MKSLKVIEKRRSVREYKGKSLSAKDMELLTSMMDNLPELNEKNGVEFTLYEDGKEMAEKLDGVAGYFGKMITAPHYVVVTCEDKHEGFRAAGYLGEYVCLTLTKYDLGTCWIDVPNSDLAKEALGIHGDEAIAGVIAVGYPKLESKTSKIFSSLKSGSLSTLTDIGYPNIETEYSKEPVSGRMSTETFVYDKKWNNMVSPEELEKLGLDEVYHYMRFAPSWGNRQPWRFVLSGDSVVLAIGKSPEVTAATENVEAGIAMLYFEVAMHSKGIKGSWHFNDFENVFEIPEQDYWMAGKYIF